MYQHSVCFGQQAVREGDWKAIHVNLQPRRNPKEQQPGPVELYDLAHDRAETTNVAADHPEIAQRLTALTESQHVNFAAFPLQALDGAN